MNIFEQVAYNRLLQSKDVAFPEIGQLTMHRCGAELDPVSGVLMPPRIEIRLDRSIVSDAASVLTIIGGLTHANKDTVKKLYHTWLRENCEVNEQIVQIGELGCAQQQADGEWIFTPQNQLAAIFDQGQSLALEDTTASESSSTTADPLAITEELPSATIDPVPVPVPEPQPQPQQPELTQTEPEPQPEMVTPPPYYEEPIQPTPQPAAMPIPDEPSPVTTPDNRVVERIIERVVEKPSERTSRKINTLWISLCTVLFVLGIVIGWMWYDGEIFSQLGGRREVLREATRGKQSTTPRKPAKPTPATPESKPAPKADSTVKATPTAEPQKTTKQPYCLVAAMFKQQANAKKFIEQLPEKERSSAEILPLENRVLVVLARYATQSEAQKRLSAELDQHPDYWIYNDKNHGNR